MNEGKMSPSITLLHGKQTEIALMKFCFSSLTWIRIHIDRILEL